MVQFFSLIFIHPINLPVIILMINYLIKEYFMKLEGKEKILIYLNNEIYHLYKTLLLKIIIII